MVVLEPAAIPSLKGRSVLISSGEFDPIVPIDHPERLGNMLRGAGAEVRVIVHPASHGLVPGDFAAAREFMAGRNSR
jgi:phospholipase/carboxylesterase